MSGRSIERYPEYLSQTFLAKEAKKTGDIVTCKNGCVSVLGPEGQCVQGWKNGERTYTSGFPKNGEFMFYTHTKQINECRSCANLGSGADGCSWSTDFDYGGPPCSSTTCGGGSLINTVRCAVKRIGFNGNKGACCLLSKSGNPSNVLSTGWANSPSYPQNGNWTFIQKGYFSSDESTIFTCNPDDLIDCSKEAPQISTFCSNFSRPDTYLAWNVGNPTTNNPIGYCTNYVNNTIETDATRNVLSGAINALSDIPNFDYGKKTINEANGINNLLELCKIKGGCETSLINLCKNTTYNDVVSAYKEYINASNRESPEAIANLNKVNACGCHLQTDQYNQSGWGRLGITTPCDPICLIPSAVPQWGSDAPVNCSQNICILNDIKIDIINSNVKDINFNTICGGCGGSGSCRCVFSDISILESNSSVGNINFVQSCGNCSAPDPANPGLFIPINCATGLPSGGNITPTSLWDTIKQWVAAHQFEVLVIIVFFIVVIFVFIWWLNKKPKTKDFNLGNKVTFNDLFGQFSDFNY
jgi:hypothetical protein